MLMLIDFVAAATAPVVTVVHHWDAITAWGTIALAIVTAIMAAVTAWMAVNTQRALAQNNQLRNDANLHYQQTREQDQQHHEDESRPVLILAPQAGVGAAARSNLISIPQTIPAQVYVHCPVQNIGVGLALNVHMSIRKDERTGFGPNVELTPIAAGDRLEPLHGRFALPVTADNFRDADLNTLQGGAWVIVLEYDDIFDNHFHTLHYKDTQRAWAKPGRGPAPDTTPKEPA